MLHAGVLETVGSIATDSLREAAVKSAALGEGIALRVRLAKPFCCLKCSWQAPVGFSKLADQRICPICLLRQLPGRTIYPCLRTHALLKEVHQVQWPVKPDHGDGCVSFLVSRLPKARCKCSRGASTQRWREETTRIASIHIS